MTAKGNSMWNLVHGETSVKTFMVHMLVSHNPALHSIKSIQNYRGNPYLSLQYCRQIAVQVG